MRANPAGQIEVNITIGHFINGEELIDNNRSTLVTDPSAVQ